MKKSLITQMKSQPSLGGPVLFKSLFIFTILFTTLNVSATPKKKHVNPEAQRIKLSQENLKKAHQINKDTYFKKGFHSQETRVLNPCHGKSGMACRMEKASSTVSFKYKTGTQKVSTFFSQIKEWFSNLWLSIKGGFRNVARSTKMNKNNLPTAGGIAFAIESSGVHGKYRFSSTDPLEDSDGEVVSVTWDFDDGSSMDIPVEELDAHATMAHVFPGAGTYDVTLRVYDNEGEYAEFSEEITVSNNSIPTPNFTATQDTGNTYNFVATANDPENSVESYSWFFGDESTPESGPTLSTVSHEFPASGEYEVAVLVRDTNGGEAWRTKKVYVGVSTPSTAVPTAIVKMNTMFGEGPLEVEFDGSLSVTHAGTAVTSYHWDFGDFESFDNTSTAADPTHTYTRPGTYFGSLKVKDSSDNEAEYFFTVFVSSPSIVTPIIMAERLDSSRRIYFNNNDIVRVATADWDNSFWDFGDRSNTVRGGSVDRNYAVDGIYPVRLVVHDVRGVRHVVTKEVVVTPEPENLAFDILVQSHYQNIETTYEYDLEINTEIQESDLTYTWLMSDGTFISGDSFQNIQHEYTQKGIKQIAVVLTSENGLSKLRHTMVAVHDGSTIRARLTANPPVGIEPLAVNFDASGTASTAPSIDKYIWRFSDGTQVDGQTASKNYSTKGQYWAQLYAKDSEGNEDLVQRKITVYDPGDEPSGNRAPVAQFVTYFETSDPHALTLDAHNSSDDEEIMSYSWDLDGAYLGQGKVLNHVFTEGLHEVALTVTDAWNRKNKISRKIRIGDTTSPTLVIGSDSSFPYAGGEISFNAESSLVPGVNVQEYLWDFGDGSPVQKGEVVKHAYSSNGEYTVKLSIKDINGNLIQETFEVTVDDPEDPTAVISLSDLSETDIVGNGGTFIGLHYPTTFKFSALESVGQRPIVDAIWDFGDGNVGYGLTPEFTIFKPGTYTVTATVFDTIGRSATETATIIIDSETDCLVGVDVTLCLRLETSDQNVLRFSESEWRFSNSLELDFATSPTGEWVKLTSFDETSEVETEIDVSDIITIDGEDLVLSKTGIIGKGIDLSRPYQLVVETESTTAEDMRGHSQEFYFGSGSITFKTEKENVDLVIKHASSNFKKYVRMGSALDVTVDNLPIGGIILSAESGTDNVIEELELSSVRNVIKVDFSGKTKSKAHKKLKKLPNGKLDLSPLGTFYSNALNSAKSIKSGYLPQYRGCNGELPPMPPNLNPYGDLFFPPAEWVQRASVLSGFDSETNFTQLPVESSRRLKIICHNSSDSHDYAWSSWVAQNAKTCAEDDEEIQAINEWWGGVSAGMRIRNHEPLKIIYQVRDSKTGVVIGNSISTTPNEIRTEMGYTMENFSWKVGVPSHVAYMKREFDIPAHFVKPEFKIKVIAPNYVGIPIGHSATWCDVYSRDNDFEARMLAPISSLRSLSRFDINGNNSVDSSYRFFPIQLERGTDSVQLIEPEMAIARYIFEVDTQDATEYNWEKVKLTWELPGHASVSYERDLLDAAAVYNPVTNKRTVRGNVYIGPEDFNPSGDTTGATSRFNYKSDSSPILTLRYEIIAEGGSPTAIGTKTFRPLYSARNARNNRDDADLLDEKVCKEIYGQKLSHYGTWELITRLKNMTKVGLQLVCNDMSLPFGGPFHLTGAAKPAHTQKGHQTGIAADIRYYNDSVSFANDYDYFIDSGPNDGVQLRELDVSEYIEFSKRAYAISEGKEFPIGSTVGSQEITQAQSIARRANLYNFCYTRTNPTPPCSEINGIPNPSSASQLKHAHILDICQRFEKASFSGDTDAELALDGCPTRLHLGKWTLERLKRVSAWLKEYERQLSISFVMGDIFYYISSGNVIASDSTIKILPSYNWQQQLIQYGKWPKVEGYQELVRKFDDTIDRLVDGPVSICYTPEPNGTNTCGFTFSPFNSNGKIREGNSIHYHHQHLELMGR